MPPVRRAIPWLILVIGLAAVWAGSEQLLRRDRDALNAMLEARREFELREALAAVEAGIDDVVDDLELSRRLIETHAVPTRAVLEALVSSGKTYVAAGVFAEDDEQVLFDPVVLPNEDFRSVMRRTARRAPPAGVAASRRVLDDERSFYRVFALSVQGDRALVLLADTRRLFRALRRQLGADERLLIQGPHGRALPMSSEELVGLAVSLPQKDGASDVPDSLSEQIGLPPPLRAQSVELFADDDTRWLVTRVTSLASLDARQTALRRQLGIVATILVLGLFGFTGWMVMSTRDSERLQGRFELARAAARERGRWKRLLDGIPVGAIAVDATGTVTLVNGAAAQLGVAEGDALLTRVPAARSVFETALNGAAASAIVEESFGTATTFELRAVPRQDEEQRVLIVISDLTELRNLEAQVVRAEKLATIGELAAGVAHEIGTPMGVVRGRAEYALSRLGEDHPQAKGLRVVIEQVDRMSRIIRSLLDYARADDLRHGVPQNHELAEVIARLEDLLEHRFERNGVTLVANVDGVRVGGDLDHLQQVLLNLVVNALDALEEGGTITIDADAGERVMVRVRDDGPGVPADLRLRIFDPFVTTKKRGQGTGLGLSVVSRLVRGYGGSVDVAEDGNAIHFSWPGGRP